MPFNFDPLEFLNKATLINAIEDAGRLKRCDFEAYPAKAVLTEMSFYDLSHLRVFLDNISNQSVPKW